MSARKLRIPKSGKVPGLTQLKQLPAERRAEVFAWLKETPYEEAAKKIEEALGIKIGRNSLSQFYSWQAHQTRLENYNELIARFEDFYTRANPNASREKVRDAGMAFFLAETTANQDREGFVDVASLDLRNQEAKIKAGFEERKITVQERKLKLLEQKAEQADQAKQVSASNLSDTEKAARMKQIFGMG